MSRLMWYFYWRMFIIKLGTASINNTTLELNRKIRILGLMPRLLIKNHVLFTEPQKNPKDTLFAEKTGKI